MKRKLLRPLDCPMHDCKEIIYALDGNGRPTSLNEHGMIFKAELNDGTKAEFAICKKCYSELTQEEADRLMTDQIYTWGKEIIRQPFSVGFANELGWFIETAISLRIVKWNTA